MSTFRRQHRVLIAGVLGVFVQGASAGFASAGAFYTVTSTAGSGSLSNAATNTSAVSWVNNGSWTATNASATWSNNLQVWNEATGLGIVNANIVIHNNTSSAQDFTITAGMEGFASGPFTSSGSIGGQYVNGSGSLGMLTSSGPLWSALADTNAVNTQFNNALFFAHPYEVVSLGNFNFSNISFANGISSHASITFSFRISAGAEASFTSTFSFQSVPAPAALALLGLIPIVGPRRRR